MPQQVSITIKLLNRAFKIKVAAEHEATVRNTAQLINEKLAELKKTFPGRDEQDYLSMSLIDHITSSKEEKINLLIETDEVIQKLEDINNLLDE